MTTLAKRAGTVGVTGALMLVAVGWAASTEAATGVPPAGDVQATIDQALGDTERADAVLGAAIQTLTMLRPTLQQRRSSGGNRRVAQPRRGGARAGRPGARGTRTIVVRRGRYYSPYYYGIGYGYGYPYYGGGYYGYGYPYYGGGYYGGSYSYTGSASRGGLGRWLLRRNRRRLRRDLPEFEAGAGSGEHRDPRPGLRGPQARRQSPARPQDHIRGEYEGGRPG